MKTIEYGGVRPVDRTRTLFGQVMGYVAATAGLFALGAYLGRNLGYGVALLC
jgi:modulator of FtsH protease